MRHTTSIIVLCFLIILLTNLVQGGLIRICDHKVEGYGTCGPNGRKICIGEFWKNPPSPGLLKNLESCTCEDRGKRPKFKGLSHSCRCCWSYWGPPDD
ncbi:Plant self-incompatibility response [Arabidopsis suecica]|uniref:Plant self-incompatibility response n=1 Tax=Arabidopsis suecica TaxID=45249 RepID=A0A8T1ZYH4_ARASU|nr:Plant self-incompatibility response [Arabidopsis suecica]